MTAAARRRRRTWLLGLAGLLVAIFFLAPFSWLVVTSFMHESDAMAVPLRLLPATSLRARLVEALTVGRLRGLSPRDLQDVFKEALRQLQEKRS